MRSTCEAMIHAVVVGPVIMLVAVIDRVLGMADVAESAVNRVAGVTPRPRAGMDEGGMA